MTLRVRPVGGVLRSADGSKAFRWRSAGGSRGSGKEKKHSHNVFFLGGQSMRLRGMDAEQPSAMDGGEGAARGRGRSPR